MTKIVRKIDSRNALFGKYMYQIKPGSMLKGKDARKWCRDQWGPSHQWVNTGYTCWQEKNPRWTEVKRPGFSSPFIYIRDEADAVMFGLVWAET